MVGKAAGYDPLAASSARVVPFGMAFAEAVGVAATHAVKRRMEPAAFVEDSREIGLVRQVLLERGAYLPEVREREPLGPHEHPAYDAYRVLLRRGLALGGYTNDPILDAPISNAVGYVYLISNIATRFLDNSTGAAEFVAANADLDGEVLRPSVAVDLTMDAACSFVECPSDERIEALLADLGGLNADSELTRGQMYQLAVGVLLPE